MTDYFDGVKFAALKLKELKAKKASPILYSIVVGNNEGAYFYQELKQKKAKEIGATIIIKKFPASAPIEEIKRFITEKNSDRSVNGIMIQLPLPDNQRPATNDLILTINPKKDVDGMRDDSHFTAPVVLAVESAFRAANCKYDAKILVLGSKGFVGRKLVEHFGCTGIDINHQNYEKKIKSADIVISATGKPGLIKEEMIKEKVVLIDVGAPLGDINKEAYKKARFVSPVPGGVGPVTIAFLMDNLLKSVQHTSI